MESLLQTRQRLLKSIQSERFDLVIIGGGITGAGVFRDAAMRGLKVALLEMRDFAYGTSSRSSKLVHGGLRYLEMLNFGLVFESTHERARLMRLSRNLVRPLPFLFPVYRTSRVGLAKVTAGMWLYDILATFSNYRMHRLLMKNSLLRLEPLLRSEGLKGGVLYYDAVTDDSRLTLETILAGLAAGGIALNYAEARALHASQGRVKSLAVVDRLTGTEYEVSTGCVVCAVGPWTESVLSMLGAVGPRLRPTKGAHIVLAHEVLPLSHAIVMSSPVDHRVMFAIPWRGFTVIGTTDTDFSGDPSETFADKSDVNYLLTTVNHYFPSLNVTPNDVIGTWAGVRPLIAPSASAALNPSQVSREHEVAVDPKGVVAVAGGKLTTYRVMAADVLKKAAPFLPQKSRGSSPTKKAPLPYSAGFAAESDIQSLLAELKSRPLPPGSAEHLLLNYGANALEILEKYRSQDPSLLEPLCPPLPFLRFEVLYAAQSEMALTVEDVLCRRIPILLVDSQKASYIAPAVTDLMADIMGWDSLQKEAQTSHIKSLAARHLAFKQS